MRLAGMPRLAGLALCLGLALLAVPGPAPAADYPDREITLVCPWPPGGSSDLLSRAVAQAAGQHLAKPMVVMNRDGANGVVATTDAKTTKPDGYTIVQGASGLFVTQPVMQPNLPFSMDNFEFLLGLTNEPILLVVNSQSPYKTVEDLLGWAKKEDKVIRFANSGNNGIPALAGAYFFKKAGVKAKPIPFKGGAPALTAILGQHVEACVVHPGEAIPHIKAGSLRPLVVSSPQRFYALPEVPTMKEKGFDIDLGVRKFIFTPKGLPADVKAKLVDVLKKVVEDATFKKTLADADLMLDVQTPEQLIAYFKANQPIIKQVLEDMPK